MPSLSPRAPLAALAALGLAASTADVASAASPTRWGAQFTDNTPRDAADTTKDWVSFYRHDGGRPATDGRLSVRVLRDGAPVANSDYISYWGGEAALPQLRTGDVGQLVDTVSGAVVASATFDGNPAFDAETCVGRATFSGTRTGSAPIDEVGAYKWVKRKGWDGSYTSPSSYWSRRDHRTGQVTQLAGTTFGGSFEKALVAGDVVWATSHQLSPTLFVSTYVERPVAACPPVVPPAQPQPLPPANTPLKDLTAPKVSLGSAPKASKLKKITLKKLGSPGLKFSITSNEGGTVNASLLLRTSKKKAPAIVGSASVVAKPGVATEVKLTLAKGAKSKLKKAPRSAKLIARITVTDAAGNATVLPDVTFKVPSA